jgi:hypothetical protein
MSLFRRATKFGSTILKKITTPVSATLRYVSKAVQKQRNVINQLDGEAKIVALIAEQVYKPPEKRANTVGLGGGNTVMDLGGFSGKSGSSVMNLDYQYNQQKHCVYVNHALLWVVIGFRGTQLDAEDLANDANIVRTDLFDEGNIRFGRSYKVDEAEALQAKVAEKYPRYRITMTGHSLAGRQVLEVARRRKGKDKEDTRYVAFNAGGFPSSVGEYPVDNTKIYLSGSDILSFGFARHPSSVIVERKDKPLGNNHSINYFI